MWAPSALISFLGTGLCSRRGRPWAPGVSDREMQAGRSPGCPGHRCPGQDEGGATLFGSPIRAFNSWAELLLVPYPTPTPNPHHMLGPSRKVRLFGDLSYSSLTGRAPRSAIVPIPHLYSFIHSLNTHRTSLLVPILGTDDAVTKKLVPLS